MRRNFNKVIKFNETDQTIIVLAGMSGPKLEETLQNAQTIFGANLYFIFMTKMQDEEEFRAYHATILDAIQKSALLSATTTVSVKCLLRGSRVISARRNTA